MSAPKKIWIGIIIFAFCFSSKVYLKDGNVIIGSITKYDSTGVVIKTSYGEVTVAPNNIDKIDFADEESTEPKSNASQAESASIVPNLVFEKTGHLSAGESTSEVFEIDETKGKLIIIVANEESYNALSDALSGDFVGLVTSLAFGMGLPIDVADIKMGKDFGYQIAFYDPSLGEPQFLTGYTKTVYEQRVIDLKKYPYTMWAIMLDNSYSILTSKDYTIKVYQVKVE